MKLPSYPSIYALGHRNVDDLFANEVVVQEKIDGSQFSFGVGAGELHIRSKGAEIQPDNPPKLFRMAVETVISLFDMGLLYEGYVYRGEAVTSKKHNTLQYEMIPPGGIVLFDIDDGQEHYWRPLTVHAAAEALGLQCVPEIYVGEANSAFVMGLLEDRESILGGPCEGLVVKNYSRFGVDKKVLMGKFVSPAFREAHETDWKIRNPGQKDVVSAIIDQVRTEALWLKSIQHLRDNDELVTGPQDIGPLLKAINTDVLKERGDEIAELLFKRFWKDISRGITRGFPEFYKEYLDRCQLCGGVGYFVIDHGHGNAGQEPCECTIAKMLTVPPEVDQTPSIMDA